MQVESLDTISEVDMVGSDVLFFYVFTSLCFTLAASLKNVRADVEVNVFMRTRDKLTVPGISKFGCSSNN